MNRIKRVSLFFCVIFQIGFVALLLAEIVGWVYAPMDISFLAHIFHFNVIPAEYPILHTLNWTEKSMGFLISMIPTALQLFILYCLIKLFKLYAKGDIFSIHNVYYIRQIGYAL